MKAIIFLLALANCASYAHGARPPRDIKVYSIQSTNDYCNPVEQWCQNKVGLVRKQDKEVLPFNQSDDYLALSPQDFQKIISSCPTP